MTVGAFALKGIAEKFIKKGKEVETDPSSNSITTSKGEIEIRRTTIGVEKLYLDKIMSRGSLFVTDALAAEITAAKEDTHTAETVAIPRSTLFRGTSLFRRPEEDDEDDGNDNNNNNNNSSNNNSESASRMEGGERGSARGVGGSRMTITLSRNRFVAEVQNLMVDPEGNRISLVPRQTELVPVTSEMHTRNSSPLPQPSESAAAAAGAAAVVAASEPVRVVLPFIPDMPQLCFIWLRLAALFCFINILCPAKYNSSVIGFQMSICVVIFICSTFYRLRLLSGLPKYLQLILQPPVLFTPLAIMFVILSSCNGPTNWDDSLNNYLIGGTILGIRGFGAGNYLTILLNPAIISLAFSAVEPIVAYRSYLPMLVPFLFAVTAVLYIIAAVISLILQSPTSIAYPLLVHCVTTPIAIAISEITGASPGITAATSVINGVLGYNIDVDILNRLGKNYYLLLLLV